MTFSIEATLGRGILLVTEARDAYATATVEGGVERVAAMLETVIEQGKVIAADIANPNESHAEGCTAIAHPNADHIEGLPDQRVDNRARILEHAGWVLAEQAFADRRLGAWIVAVVFAAVDTFDAVSLALEQRDRAALLATTA